MSKCRTCNGRGSYIPKCRECDGRGRIIDDEWNHTKHAWGIVYKRCIPCNGTGNDLRYGVIGIPCPTCKGGTQEVSYNNGTLVIAAMAIVALILLQGRFWNTSSERPDKPVKTTQKIKEESDNISQLTRYVSAAIPETFAGRLWKDRLETSELIRRVVATGSVYDYCRLKSAADAINQHNRDSKVASDHIKHYADVIYNRMLSRCAVDTDSKPKPYTDILTDAIVERELLQPAYSTILEDR